MVSMKDVAKLAGVSISTVSRVINNSIPVDINTRRRVEEAIRQLDYKPNLLAKGLRIKSGNLIGLIVPETVQHHAFASFISYIEKSVTKHGYNLILGYNHNDPNVEARFIDNLIRRNVDGIIFSRVSDESHVLRIMDDTHIPVVIIDRALENEDVPSVILDNYKAGQMAAEYFLKIGHRNIGCVTGPLNISLSRERLRGFKDTLIKYGINIEDGDIYEGNFKFDSGVMAADFFTSRENKSYTAIWAQNDLMAIGVINALMRKGIRIPDDISVMGMDDISFATMMVPSLTTIAQPFEEMCEIAVDMIFKQKDNISIKKKVLLEPQLVIRETTKELK